MTTWHNPRTNPPPMLHSVILACHIDPIENEGRTYEASEGYRVPSGGYSFATGHDIADDRIYAWAEIPEPPPPEVLCGDWVCSIEMRKTQPGDDAIVS